ncbi:hypothetical protein K440DRAFT_130561 [Wilcoxina mikolae CBS 423.85]|nr:hypothetical protein K440DRAFT_130561 [Wilcoxina mikolae CBS 423.85]
MQEIGNVYNPCSHMGGLEAKTFPNNLPSTIFPYPTFTQKMQDAEPQTVGSCQSSPPPSTLVPRARQ